jgi:hypothetical protein
VTNDSEQYVEDLLAQVAGRFFRAFCLLDRRDALKKNSHTAMSVSYNKHYTVQKALQRNAR